MLTLNSLLTIIKIPSQVIKMIISSALLLNRIYVLWRNSFHETKKIANLSFDKCTQHIAENLICWLNFITSRCSRSCQIEHSALTKKFIYDYIWLGISFYEIFSFGKWITHAYIHVFIKSKLTVISKFIISDNYARYLNNEYLITKF